MSNYSDNIAIISEDLWQRINGVAASAGSVFRGDQRLAENMFEFYTSKILFPQANDDLIGKLYELRLNALDIIKAQSQGESGAAFEVEQREAFAAEHFQAIKDECAGLFTETQLYLIGKYYAALTQP
jgi:hypothetical protein